MKTTTEKLVANFASLIKQNVDAMYSNAKDIETFRRDNRSLWGQVEAHGRQFEAAVWKKVSQ